MFVRAADGQFAREQMLSHFLPAAQNPFPHYPIIIRGGYGGLPHPNAGAVKPAGPAREAESRFVGGQMLARALPAAQNPFPHYPIYYP